MKKIIVLLVVVCVCMTSCMPTSLSEKEQNNQQGSNGQIKDTYNSIDDLDFASGHIKAALRENFLIDADVPVNAPTKCGIYELSSKILDKTEQEYTEELRQLVNDYYGENTATIMGTSDITNSSAPNCYYRGNDGGFCKGNYNDYGNQHQKINIIAKYFYEWGFEYDKQMMDDVIGRFMKHFEGIIPDGMNGDYECVHIDDEYWEYLEGKYTKDELEMLWERENEEYYAISMYSEIEEGIYFKAHTPIVYNSINGEKLDEVSSYSEEGYALSHRPQWFQIIVSEEGEVVSVRFSDNYTIGNKIEEKQIISAKEALKLFYKEYEGVLLQDELIVKNISLEYMVCLDNELDDNSYRNAYLAPVWVIRYDSELDYYGIVESTYVFSAVDGTVVIGKGEAY